MNILSNILKIDYTLYIINDKKIKQEIINKIFDDDYYLLNIINYKLIFDKITIIKYNNIYYLHEYCNGIIYKQKCIYSYDNNKRHHLIDYNNESNISYVNSYLHKTHNEFKYEKEYDIIFIYCNNLKYLNKAYTYSDKYNKIKLSIIKYTYYINNSRYYSKIYNKQHKIYILNYNNIKINKYYYYNYKCYIKYYKDIYYNKDKYNINNINNINNKNIFIIKYNIIICVFI